MQGEDVTHNALTGAIQGLPLSLAASSSSSNGDGGGSSLPAEVEVRGEVFMTTSDFEQVRGVMMIWCGIVELAVF
jgi:NAD-dependent DNA ligase